MYGAKCVLRVAHENTLTVLSGLPHLLLLYRYRSNETISLLLECSLLPVLPNFLSLVSSAPHDVLQYLFFHHFLTL